MPSFSQIIEAVQGFFSRVLALITPFGSGRELRSMGRGLRIFLHVLILTGGLTFLWWLNQYFDVGRLLKAPNFFGIPLRNFWLPILCLLLYVMTWLGWWLWTLLGPEEEASDFPDIDQAWEEALTTLRQSQIDLTDAPLFLVIGKAAGGEEALFAAAQLALMVKQTPRGPDSPLHVYANRDGIYLTCAGASLLGRHAEILSGEAEVPAINPALAGGDGSDGGANEEDMFKTLRPKGRLKDVQAIMARAREQGRSPEQLTEAERGEIRSLVSEEEAEQVRQTRKPQASLLRNAAEVERLSARFKHLCRLIVRDRRPFCTLNGILLLVPFAASDHDDEASQTGALCQQELAAAREILQVHCPVLAMFCDLEKTPGFREFVERFPADQRQRRLGQRFPLVPDLELDSLPAMIEGGAAWIAQALFPNWVFKLFRLETPGKEELAAVVRGNARLYQLLGEVRERQKRVGKILTRAVASELGGPPLFAGCYIAGTGRDAAREQAFVAGVFRRLIENQNYISWTNEALQEEADYQRWTKYGYAGLTVAALALAALAAFFWSKR